jgi:TRAP transporter TAXI family solute receptor
MSTLRAIGYAAAVTAVAAIAATTPATAQMYGLGTGKQGFFTYSAGAAIAKVASDKGLALRIQPFGGTSAYVPAVAAKEVDFGLANELETNYAVTGTAIYKDKPQTDIRVVSIMNPLYSVLFVRKDSPIKTIADLKGKRVPTDFVSQRVLDILMQGALANGGLSYKDVQKVPVPNVVGGANEFAQGKVDAFIFALGAGKVAEIDAKVGGLRVLPADPSPEAIARTRKFIPVGYTTTLQPARARAGIAMPTVVYAYDLLLLTNDKVPEDTVYKLTKALHDNKKALAEAFRPLAGFQPDRMAKDMGPVTFHAGAIKYYKEIGAWPPKSGS